MHCGQCTHQENQNFRQDLHAVDSMCLCERTVEGAHAVDGETACLRCPFICRRSVEDNGCAAGLHNSGQTPETQQHMTCALFVALPRPNVKASHCQNRTNTTVSVANEYARVDVQPRSTYSYSTSSSSSSSSLQPSSDPSSFSALNSSTDGDEKLLLEKR